MTISTTLTREQEARVRGIVNEVLAQQRRTCPRTIDGLAERAQSVEQMFIRGEADRDV